MAADDFTGPTTDAWQRILAADEAVPAPPWRFAVPVRLPDGRHLLLPIRRLPGSEPHGVASLIANQASFDVVRALAAGMTAMLKADPPEIVAGLPTLGLAFAPLVAEALGHTRFAPLGYSRKFWYDDALSVPVRSVTTPTGGKRLYLDPNLVPLLAGRRVAIVDDAVSSGSTVATAVPLLEGIGCTVTAIAVAMKQGDAWRERLAALGPHWPDRVRGVFASPRLLRVADGWVPVG